MKYYKFHGKVDQIPERYWKHLKANEPGVIELTKEEYENDRGIRPQRTESIVRDTYREEPVGTVTEEKVVTQVSGENTRKEIIEEILNRGTDIPEYRLKQKNKHQLLEML